MVVHAAIGRGRHYVSLPPPLPTSFLLQTLLPSPFVFVCVLCCRRRAPRSLSAKRQAKVADSPMLSKVRRAPTASLCSTDLAIATPPLRGGDKRQKKRRRRPFVCLYLFSSLFPRLLDRIGPCLNPVPFFCAARLTTEILFFGMPCVPSVSRACAEQYKKRDQATYFISF